MTPMAQALSTALLHFIWQGIAGQVLLGIALLSLRKSSANSRYFASCIVLAILAVAPLVTVWVAYPAAPVSAELAVNAPTVAGKADVASAVQGSVANRSFGSIDHWILPIWAAGVFVFALRLAWAAGHASSLRRRGIEADPSIESLVMGLAGRLGIRRKLRVLVSSLADVPSVVGWIRPIILLPAAVVVGLTPQQLEALLAHELAHIRRHDYVVNILQMVVETLLFYHPSVWWISSRIRHERELCCDDVAVSSCGNAVVYARALAQLERLRPVAPSLAVGSADGSLYGRIQRLLGSGRNEHRASRLASVACLLVGVLCVGVVISTARAK
jgi:beta-lactamase regulating signal transducer with metallopeptidase domain